MSGEQLNIFAVEPVPSRGAYDEPERERVYQLTELPGDTFEEIFAARPSESVGLEETA